MVMRRVSVQEGPMTRAKPPVMNVQLGASDVSLATPVLVFSMRAGNAAGAAHENRCVTGIRTHRYRLNIRTCPKGER